MVELMVTLVVLLVVVASASTAYVQLYGGFKVQSKITETQLDTLGGLELFRYDVEMAGFGLPYGMNSLTYTEGASDPLLLNDANATVSRPPRAFAFSNNSGPGGSDVLAIKSTIANLNTTTRKWSLMYVDGANCKVMSWGNSDLSFINGERVIVLDDANRNLLPLSSTWKLTFQDNNCTGLPNPTVGINLVYGVNSSGTPSMPFNRVDYYLGTPDSLPSRCFPGSYILYRATINQNGGARNPQPAIDCVADFQVAFGRDTNGDGGVDTWNSTLALTAAQIRAQLRELRIFLLYHEGGKDDSFRMTATMTLGDTQTGTLSTFAPTPPSPLPDTRLDPRRYRWKVAKLVIKPMNLDEKGP